MGKAKVAPIRRQSIPKLELAAAVIGVRVAFFIKQQLDVTISKTTFWSDSATTLQWIYNSKEKHNMNVANRVAEILETTSPSDWRHVPGVLNPADDGTRGLKLTEFKPDCRWFNGPLFFKHDPTNWPPTKVPNYPLEASMALSRANQPLIDPKRFSSFEKLKRVLAFVILFISNLKTTTKSFHLTIKTVNMSKIYLLRQSQELSFEEELDCLRKDQNVPAHSKIKNSLPFNSDDGVIRANGRLANANQLEEILQTPLILSGKEHITFLMLRDIHNHNGHTAILRFTARRGNPHLIVSDNGRNFVGASRELITKVNQFDHQEISDRLLKETIEWKFIPPYASHFGGAWERLVQSSKRILYSVIGSQMLTEETFHSFLTQVEEILNSRPLTYVPDNGLSYQPITPNHFLIGRPHKRLPSILSITKDYNKDWKRCNTLSHQFWTRLLREFIPTMARRPTWIKDQKPLEVGSLVWILEDMTPRGIWPVGIVEKLSHSNDGKVRGQEDVKHTVHTISYEQSSSSADKSTTKLVTQQSGNLRVVIMYRNNDRCEGVGNDRCDFGSSPGQLASEYGEENKIHRGMKR
ncbi:uncharacterized protein LOC142346293 [Convolutriloba macropyga]|uniref:uncharacterized protein LOC142346293 n=1 Tax=Convolutriloba macropyga TaxID=536237 RepID=UPI003F51ACB1